MRPPNEALERRRRLYQERVVRRLIVKKPGWDDAWTLEARQALDKVHDESACRILGYQAPVVVADADVLKHGPAPAAHDWTLMQGLARLQIVRRESQRQFELFGWRTPAAADLYGQANFEKAKAAYWNRVLAEPLEQMHVLKDTADFGANYLLRLLYLHGETTPPLRSVLARWRGSAGFERDVNFSSTIEATIKERFLAFKFWLDAPFAAADPARPDDSARIQAARRVLIDASPSRFAQKEIAAEMCYWSENHQVLFGTAAYLAGQLWPDEVFRAGRSFRAEGPDAVRPGDVTGRQHVESARARLLGWLDDRLRFGFSEWNAPGYYEEDFAALFNLADFALDEEVRIRAAMAIDLLLFDLARLSHEGSFGVTGGRSHFKHKNCGYQQSTGDLAEVIFATRGAIVDAASGSAGSFASSTSYDVPEVLMRIAADTPTVISDRRRVSLDPREAALYGIGTTTEEDVLFWWSRGAFLIKEIIDASGRVVRERHLHATNPFSATFPILLALAATGVAGDVDDVADSLSVLTEGSALTAARLTTYRTRHAMLSSVRDFHPQQLNFQTQFCQATLGMGATVWATYPPSGSENLREFLTASAATAGAGAGALAGAKIGSLFGPIGTGLGALGGGIAGGIGGGVATHGALTDDKGEAIEIFPTSDDGPDWWTGTGVVPMVAQVEGAAILAFSPRAIQWWLFKSQTHAWFPTPAFDKGSVVQRSAPESSESDGLWTFGRVGDGYVGLYSAREPAWTTDGPWAGRELVAEGDGNVFIIQIGDREQFGSYASFVDRVSRARINVSDIGDDDTQCSYDVPGGKRLELHLDGRQVRYGGPGISSRFPRFESPYFDGHRVGHRTWRYTIAYDGRSLHHNFSGLKTDGARARVIREVDGPARDRDLEFLAIARRGAMKVWAENSIEACGHSLEVEGANSLAIDVCLTADGHAVAWHDWDPDSLLAALRRLGWADVGRYKPVAPANTSPFWRPTNGLRLAELRAHYGYEPTNALDAAPPAPAVPTLREIVDVVGSWPGLRHLVINAQVPGEQAGHDGVLMLRAILNALPAAPAFRTTILSPAQEVVRVMRSALPPSDARVLLGWHSLVAEPPRQPASAFDPSAAPPVPPPSAVGEAISLGTSVVSMGRPPLASTPGSIDIVTPVRFEAWNWDGFNFNPRKNQGRQIDLFLAGPIDDPLEQRWLVDEEISGLMTNEVPQLVRIVRQG